MSESNPVVHESQNFSKMCTRSIQHQSPYSAEPNQSPPEDCSPPAGVPCPPRHSCAHLPLSPRLHLHPHLCLGWSSPTGGTCCAWAQVTAAARTQVRRLWPSIFPAASAARRDSSSCCSRDHLHPEQAAPRRVTSDPGPHHARQGTPQRWSP